MANIVNNYNNTEELMKRFPVEHPTYVADGIGKKIQNRLLTGFENWNTGYDAWEAWRNQFCTANMKQDQAATLDEYKALMKQQMEEAQVKRLYFDSMLISGEWAAIHYRTDQVNPETQEREAGDRMQFLHF